MSVNKAFIDLAEISRCKILAKKQTDDWLASGVPGTRDFDNARYEGKVKNQTTGLIGETGFAKMFGFPIPAPRGLYAKCPDFISEGWNIDIKSTDRQNGRLISHIGNAPKDGFNIYVLCRVLIPFVYFAGWVFGWQLVNDRRIKDLGRGPTYVFPSNELRDFKSFDILPEKSAEFMQSVRDYEAGQNEKYS